MATRKLQDRGESFSTQWYCEPKDDADKLFEWIPLRGEKTIFMVRPSELNPGLYTLRVKNNQLDTKISIEQKVNKESGKIEHCLFNQKENSNVKYARVSDLIEHFKKNKLSWKLKEKVLSYQLDIPFREALKEHVKFEAVAVENYKADDGAISLVKEQRCLILEKKEVAKIGDVLWLVYDCGCKMGYVPMRYLCEIKKSKICAF